MIIIDKDPNKGLLFESNTTSKHQRQTRHLYQDCNINTNSPKRPVHTLQGSETVTFTQRKWSVL